MVPLLKPSDDVIISPSSSFNINDLVVFKDGKRLICHRLIYISPDGKKIITRGDNNLKIDPPGKLSDLVGKVEQIKRGGKLVQIRHLYLSQSVNYLHELSLLTRSLNKNKIRSVLLKGLPLHLFLEGSYPKRLYLDADLLISPTDKKVCRKALTRQGFFETDSQELKRDGYKSQLTFVKKSQPFPVVIDLHLEPAIGFTRIAKINELLPRREKINHFFWNNTRLIKINRFALRALKAEALFIYLCLHLFHHNFEEPYRYDLLMAVAQRQGINWNKTARLINSLSLNNFIYPVILNLKKYYRPSLPASFVKKIKPTICMAGLIRSLGVSFSPHVRGNRYQEALKRYLLLLILSPVGLTTKIKTIFSPEVVSYYFLAIKSLLLRRDKNSS